MFAVARAWWYPGRVTKSYDRSAPTAPVSRMSSIVRFSSWNVKPPTLRTMPAMMWFAACESGWPSDHAGRPSALFSTPRNPFASRRSALVPRSPSEWSASPITRRIPAKVGPSQLIEG